MIIQFLICQIVLLLGSGVYYFAFNGSHQAFSLTFGIVTGTVNTGVLLWAWRGIISKNSFALAGMGIVFKYAFLGIVLYVAFVRLKVDSIFFLLGLFTFLPSILVAGYLKSVRDSKSKNIQKK